ncbi:hypothetical protein BKA62DRAFT_683036 [Auriculariales sp. MPI-PUGE-AT-0066]|nr:hypothetical protein BKA62DRAFT_683036 [Auriculariales sp. MPI-PUGE-AT-0066]
MSGPVRRAGGLYGGLQFSNAIKAPQSASEAALVSPPAEIPEGVPAVVAVPAAVAADLSAPAEEATKPSAAGWSASLAFAPTRRAPAKSKPRASAPSATSGAISAAPAAVIIEAAPVLHEDTNTSTTSTATGGWGKKVKPPSMVLEEDVNGFRNQHGGAKKNNKKKKKSQQQQQHQYNPNEQYDPLKPNDYNEYKRFRAEQVAKRTKRGRSEDEEDAWEERDRYGARARRDEDDFVPSFSPPPSAASATHVDTNMTGDEAYARRLAMSQGRSFAPPAPPQALSPPPASAARSAYQEDEDDWQPRAGLGGSAKPKASNASVPTFAPARTALAPTFEPAHEPAPAHSFVPIHEAPSTSIDADDVHAGLGAPLAAQPQPTHTPTFTPAHNKENTTSSFLAPITIPGLGAPGAMLPSMPMPPPMFAPPPALGSPPIPPTAAPAAPPNDIIEAARARAAAIAARLSKIAAPPAPPPQPEPDVEPEAEREPAHRPDPHGFAARLMAKWGHVTGQGIGARPDEAIVVPLMVTATNDASGKGKKKADEEQQQRQKVGMGSAAKGAMGKIVNANDNVGKDDIVRFGRPSRVVVLTNMVEPDEINDDELHGEIGDECGKYGAVERVLPHMCANQTVRVFVQYGGQPAAWKCVRELDGRFFGGRTVRARYYDERRWGKGDLEWQWE